MSLERFQKYEVTMGLSPQANPFSYDIPDGFEFRFYKEGDEKYWSYIQWKSGQFASNDEAKKSFEDTFGSVKSLLSDRMVFAINEKGNTVGTVTAWEGTGIDKDHGCLYRLAVLPEYQNKGIGQALISYILPMLKEKYEHVFLTTIFRNWLAVSIFFKVGFVPRIGTQDDRDVWTAVLETIVGSGKKEDKE
ncbi:hypothetical protein WA158_006277 [Blastocystis sp. Blastoise]